jgi:hypothetical protein
MSYDGYQYFVFAPLPAAVKPKAFADTLIRRATASLSLDDDAGEPPTAGPPMLGYVFGYGETHPIFLSLLDEVIKAPWTVVVAITTSEVRTLAAADVGKLLTTCAILSKRLGSLATMLAGLIEDGEEEVDSVREILGDATRLLDSREADRDVLRVAQVFAALVRGLQAAKKQGTTLIAVQRILD